MKWMFSFQFSTAEREHGKNKWVKILSQNEARDKVMSFFLIDYLCKPR